MLLINQNYCTWFSLSKRKDHTRNNALYQISAVNDCIGNPCQNGGACHDLVGQFKCDCPVGFAGDRCSQNIDDCKDNMCSNGATCVDGIGDYTCACTPGYEGHFCQEKIGK